MLRPLGENNENSWRMKMESQKGENIREWKIVLQAAEIG